MQVISGYYENGKFQICDDDMPKNIKKAKLYIVVVPEEENENFVSADDFRINEFASEEDFKMLGLYSFFGNETDDQDIDWEECFGLK